MVKLTGRRASDIIDFLEILKRISQESIFHHLHQYFLKPCVHSVYHTSDFAVWVAEWLEEKGLAERLANINPYAYTSIDDLRWEIIHIIEDYLKEYPPPRPVLPGGEFFFNEGATIVIPSGFEARDLKGFIHCLERVNRSSIYFHFFEARLRLEKEGDDFTEWLSTSMGRDDISDKIRGLDPYMFDLDELRSIIIEILKGKL